MQEGFGGGRRNRLLIGCMPVRGDKLLSPSAGM